MVWNPSPKVAAARDFGEKFGYSQVLILAIGTDTFEIVSYGKNRPLCKDAEKMGDKLSKLIQDGELGYF